MKLKAIIIDDEIKVAKTLKNIIENNVQDVDVVTIINEPTKTPELICQYQPDIVFIDIEMPGMNGFEVLDCVTDINFEIVFVTAYDQYAIDAIKRNALDYILKPIQIKEVVQSIAKVRDKITLGKNKLISEQITLIQQEFQKKNIVKIPTLAGIDFVETEKIIYIKASGTYSEVFCVDNSLLIMIRSITEVMQILNNSTFFRSHRSYIINITHIKRYINSNGGTIIMSNGKEIPLSRRKKDEFNELINNVYSK